MKKIVIVEDDLFMREELALILEKEKYEVLPVTDFVNAAEQILHQMPDLVILDINLPGATGFEICKTLKRRGSVPVLMLTSRDQVKDEVHALALGADEYLIKPCHKDRLLARVSNILRRYEGNPHFIEAQGVKLDRNTYTLYIDDYSVVLPEKQGKMMVLFLTHQGETVTKDMLFQELWGTAEYIDEGAVHVNITRLKKLIKSTKFPGEVVSIRGVGYQLIMNGAGENG